MNDYKSLNSDINKLGEKNILPQTIPRRKTTAYANANAGPVFGQTQQSGVKLVIRWNSTKDRQYHGLSKKDKKIKIDLQNTTQKTKD
jgi:hypothetical protein